MKSSRADQPVIRKYKRAETLLSYLTRHTPKYTIDLVVEGPIPLDPFIRAVATSRSVKVVGAFG
tara:strand:+ start:11839 stop:12030 length:192 start_codon:yes stop_codon:yes gene_type:complete